MTKGEPRAPSAGVGKSGCATVYHSRADAWGHVVQRGSGRQSAANPEALVGYTQPTSVRNCR